MCTEVWLGNLKEGIRLENTGVVGRIMLKQIIKEAGCVKVDCISMTQ
jgi:hypothetical protein